MAWIRRTCMATILVLGVTGCQDEDFERAPRRFDMGALADSLELGYSMLDRAYQEADSLPPGMGMMFQSMEQMHAQMMQQRRRMASGMGHGMMGGRGMRGEGGGQQGMHQRMHAVDSTTFMREWHQQMIGMHAQMAELHEQEGRNNLAAHHREMERRHAGMVEAIPEGTRGVEAGGEERPKPSGETATVRGSAVYKSNCAVCHGSDGQGLGTFPPLSGSSWVQGEEETLVQIVLHGLEGPIDVGGKGYDGLMPAFGSRLSNREVAALLTYLRSSWGNDAGAVDVDEVREVRTEYRGRTRPWTASTLRSDDDQ